MGRIEDAEQRRGVLDEGAVTWKMEMAALEQCLLALDGLNIPARRRVWSWLRDRFGIAT